MFELDYSYEYMKKHIDRKKIEDRSQSTRYISDIAVYSLHIVHVQYVIYAKHIQANFI